MPANPSVAAALVCVSSEPFSEQSINEFFRACTVARGVEWLTPRSLNLHERLWDSDGVMVAIEGIQSEHKANRDTKPARRRLLEAIDVEIRATAE